MHISQSACIAMIAVSLVANATSASAQTPDSIRICLAPATVETSANADAAVEAARATFTTFLTGPSIRSEPLKARLESQAREEARQAGCPYILLTTLKLVSKRSGGGVLGQVAAGAVRQGAAEVGIASGSAAGRVASSAVYAGVSQASMNYAVTIRRKDELTLGYRLETAGGAVVAQKRDKRSAKSDGEDLLTPLVQRAAEVIVTVVKR